MSTTVTELCMMSVTEMAEAIRSGQMSSREVVEAQLRRIEEVNPAVNTVPVVLGGQAPEAARAADRAAAGGGELPPLHGVPFTVKGTSTSPERRRPTASRRSRPPMRVDAPVVERMRAADAIPIGHTNLPDFATGWHTDSELWGATVNPWDRSRTPGASSGGEAAALATGMTPLGTRQRHARVAALAGPVLRGHPGSRSRHDDCPPVAARRACQRTDHHRAYPRIAREAATRGHWRHGAGPAVRRDAAGTRRRLPALIAMGHPSASLARASGIPPRVVWGIVRGTTVTVSQDVHAEVSVLYEKPGQQDWVRGYRAGTARAYPQIPGGMGTRGVGSCKARRIRRCRSGGI